MFTFDARTVQPAVSMDPVPDNWYKVIVRKSNMKPVREKPNESYLELQMEIVEGQFQGRTLYWNLNIFNSSQQAVEIAYKQLSAICHVVGQYQVNAQNAQDNVTPMLHNIPFYVHAVITQGQRGPMNNIKGVKDIYGNEPGKTGGAMPQQPAAPGGAWAAAPTAPAPGWQAPPAAPPAPAFQGGNSGGTAPGGFTPPPNPAAPAQWAPQAPAAPPPQQPPQQFQPPQQPQQPQQPPAPQGGWTTGGAPTAPPPQPQYQQPQQPPPQQYQQPPQYAPGPGGPAGAAPWQR